MNHLNQSHMRILVTSFLLFSSFFVFGQHNSSRQLLQFNQKKARYYVALDNTSGNVYLMGYYMDPAGSGRSFISTDTVLKQADGTYAGGRSKVVVENNKTYLVIVDKKNRKGRYILYNVKDQSKANYNLNNAYYLGNYFKLSDELNSLFPKSHHSFRNGFSSWGKLDNKNIDHWTFRDFADKRLAEIKDSIVGLRKLDTLR